MQMTLEEVLDFLDKKIEDINPEDMKPCAGIRLNAICNIYKKTKNERAKCIIIKAADRILDAKELIMNDLKVMEYTAPITVLFTAYDITGEDKYKIKAIELEKADMYTGLAYDMMYESYFGGKEKYHDITVAFSKFDNFKDMSDMGQAFYMEALIDTIEAINQPVYELYRSLVDLFRQNIIRLMSDKKMPFENPKANMLLAYSIKKACDMRVILAEKYEDYAQRTFDECSDLYCAYALAFSQMGKVN